MYHDGWRVSEIAVCAALTVNIGMMDLQEELYWVVQHITPKPA
jgi:hypothetical protein